MGVSWSGDNIIVIVAGKHPQELLRSTGLQLARFCAQYFLHFLVHYHIYFRDDKATFRGGQDLVQGHRAKRETEQLLNHGSDCKTHVHNHWLVFLEAGSISQFKKKKKFFI